MIDGVNWAMPEIAFRERFGQFKERKFPWGHRGIVAIKFCYGEEQVGEEMITRSDGKVFLTFVSEILGYLFVQEFHGYAAMDSDQYWRGAYTRVTLAKEDIHRRQKRHAQYGDARFDRKVWNYHGPCNAKQSKYVPQWEELQEELKRNPSSEYSRNVHRVSEA